MKYVATALCALALTTTAATAGGIDRTTLSFSALFDKGRVLTTSLSSVSPDISGTYVAGLGGGTTGNMAQSYASLSFSYKADVNEKLSYAIYVNKPYGADALYTMGAYTGLEAHWSSDQIAALLKYKVSDRASVFGGLRYVTSSATINIPAALFAPNSAVLGNYSATAASDSQVGYVVGAAYEIPDIALRVSLAYQSEITHSFATAERFSVLNGGTTVNGTTDIKLPQSLTLDFQSGVAKDTLVFGSVRWSEWSQWHVRPGYYETVIKDEVTGFDNDVITYSIGVGRKLKDNFSVFARYGYEAPSGGVASRLSPTDGMSSFGVGGSWTKDNVKITGGVEYVKVGDALDGSGTQFTGNTALGIGMNVAFTF